MPITNRELGDLSGEELCDVFPAVSAIARCGLTLLTSGANVEGVVDETKKSAKDRRFYRPERAADRPGLLRRCRKLNGTGSVRIQGQFHAPDVAQNLIEAVRIREKFLG